MFNAKDSGCTRSESTQPKTEPEIQGRKIVMCFLKENNEL